MPSRARHLDGLKAFVVALAFGGAAALAYRETLTFPLFDVDTYPQISAARWDAPGGFSRAFLRDSLDGRYPENLTLRPVHQLLVGATHAIVGLDPRGHQTVTLLLLAACAAALVLTTRRWLGGAAWLGPCVAAAFFIAHPVLINVAPCVPRRAELLLMLFQLGALAVLPMPGERPSTWRAAACGLCVLLACGSKEPGVFAVALCVIHLLVFRAWATPETACGFSGKRFVSLMARLIALAVGAVTAYLLLRWGVLGGLGGYLKAPHLPLTVKWGTMLRQVIAPWPDAWRSAALATAIGLAGWLLVMTVWLAVAAGRRIRRTAYSRARPGDVRPDVDVVSPASCAAMGLAYALVSVGVLSLSPTVYPWYSLNPVAGMAILLGAFSQAGAPQLLARDRSGNLTIHSSAKRRSSAFAAVLIGVAGAAAAAGLWCSPLWRDYRDWRLAGEALRSGLENLSKAAERAPRGRATAVSVPYTFWARPAADRARLGNVTMLATFSAEAWLDLLLPDRNIRVLSERDARGVAPRPDETLLVASLENLYEDREAFESAKQFIRTERER